MIGNVLLHYEIQMKTLYLLRHAKSGHEEYILNDIERHLSAKGYKDAEEQADLFKRNYKNPQLIISSPAIRAFTTALIFAKHLGYDITNIEINLSIYEASVSRLLYVISELSDELNNVMLVGHNPGFTDLTNALCGNVIDDLPTTGIAAIELSVNNWNSLLTRNVGNTPTYKGKLI